VKKSLRLKLSCVSALLTLLCSLASAQNATFDMMDWMTMDPFGSHITGSGTPIWTVMDSAQNNFYWIKNAQGYPWDVKKYDANLIYDWITEVSWTDPKNFKKHLGSNGMGYPLTPRFVPYTVGAAASRLSQIKIPSSSTNFEIHDTPGNCSAYHKSNLGYAKTEVWGPYYESLGGDLPPNTETLHLNWMWSCDSSYRNCKTKEVYTLMQVYGNVRWQNYKLVNGQYVLQQTSLRNVITSGTITPVHPCWK
jgi:hypothetical protein